MAEFQEVIPQFHRMCKSGNCIEIKTCPLMKKSSAESCIRYAFENPCDFENIVMVWATEHPEPKYPTWTEWFSKQGLVELKAGQFVKQTENEYVYECKTVAILTDKAAVPIPADIAEKLGIEPKEK